METECRFMQLRAPAAIDRLRAALTDPARRERSVLLALAVYRGAVDGLRHHRQSRAKACIPT